MARYSGDPVPVPVVRRVDPHHVAIAKTASADYLDDHRRLVKIADDMAEVGALQLAQDFRRFAYYAKRASDAEVA